MMAENGPDTRKRKIQPEDIAALQKRAYDIAHMGAPKKADLIRRQSQATYALALDFWRLGVLGQDFPRWMSQNSGMARTTCQERLDQGREMKRLEEEGRQANRNGSGLLAEYRERKLTPRPELDIWAADDDED